jgi:hypothetical protein
VGEKLYLGVREQKKNVEYHWCISIATCFDPAGSSSGTHYINMLRVIGFFVSMDPYQLFF